MNVMDTAITDYLDSKRSILWGKAFDVHSNDGKQAALQFIRQLWIELEDIESDIHYRNQDHEQ